MTKVEKLILELHKELQKERVSAIILAFDDKKGLCHRLITPDGSKTMSSDLINLVVNCMGEGNDKISLEVRSTILNSSFVYLQEKPELIPAFMDQLQEVINEKIGVNNETSESVN